MPGVQTVTLNDAADGQRLDRWLKRAFPQATQGRIEKMCRKGELRLDGGRVKASARLATGQTLRIPPMPDGPAPDVAPTQRAVDPKDAALLREAVLYEDSELIALNKPPGLAVQGGSRTERHIDGLAAALVPEGAPKPKLVHRLDRDTSGVLVLAKTGRAAASLAKAFQSRQTRKIYWAAVAGCPSLNKGTIRYGLVKQAGHGPHGAGEKMVAIEPNQVKSVDGAKSATTDFAVVDTVAKRAAWVAMAPISGRTHQLRVHMAAIGHPIVGDGKYGTNAQENLGDGWGAQLGGSISRKLHLHARSLTIAHPVTGHPLTITASLPVHMAATWDFLGWTSTEDPGDPFDEDM